jgi:hypothetical protein
MNKIDPIQRMEKFDVDREGALKIPKWQLQSNISPGNDYQDGGFGWSLEK